MRRICKYCKNKDKAQVCLTCDWLYQKYPSGYDGKIDFTDEELKIMEEPINVC